MDTSRKSKEASGAAQTVSNKGLERKMKERTRETPGNKL